MAIRHLSVRNINSRNGGAYYTRAWTFQEFQFSLRRLVFEDDAIEWHCERGGMREYVFEKAPKSNSFAPDGLDPRSTVHTQLAAAMPTLMSLEFIIDAFNIRNLSFPEDAFPAFVGIQNLIEQTYQPGFLYGLSEFWFELALFWTPYNRCNLRRRVASTPRPAVKTAYQLPSWSWIGWAGTIHFLGDDIIKDHWLSGNTFTEPVTMWYTLADSTSPDRRPINTGWHRYRSAAIERRLVTLPKGWKEESDNEGGIVYRHPRRPKAKYLYPFPVPDASSTSVNISVPQTAFLSAQTSRAFLSGKRVHTKRFRVCAQYPLWLTSSRGQHVGFLHLSSEEEQSFFKRTGKNSSSMNPLELVAISKGISAHLGPPDVDWDFEIERLHRKSKYEDILHRPPVDCMFVLWIEWKDGVAYRRACGVVTAEAWEREKEKELVDLILG